MRTFTAMLVAISTLAAQTADAYAKSGKSAKTESGLEANFEAAAHAAYSETGIRGRDMKTYDEALAIMIVVLNRTDSGAYGKKGNVRSVVYDPEYRGPINHGSPWAKGGHRAQFFAMADGLKPYFVQWQLGGRYIPDRLLKYKTAWHSDNIKHTDWGDFVGQEGDTCFYTAWKHKTGKVKDTCTAGRKGAEPVVRLDVQAVNANVAVPAVINRLVASK